MLAPVRITPPAIMPVSLAEAKLHLRVDHLDEDVLIGGLIRAATEHLDGWTGILGRCLVEQEWRQDFDAFASCLPLPLGPVISIASVSVGGTPVDSSAYALRTDAGGRARVEFDGVSASGAASIVYKAGYPTIPEAPAVPVRSTVPEPLKVAIMLLVCHWYQSREAATPASINELPFAVNALITTYRRVGV